MENKTYVIGLKKIDNVIVSTDMVSTKENFHFKYGGFHFRSDVAICKGDIKTLKISPILFKFNSVY